MVTHSHGFLRPAGLAASIPVLLLNWLANTLPTRGTDASSSAKAPRLQDAQVCSSTTGTPDHARFPLLIRRKRPCASPQRVTDALQKNRRIPCRAPVFSGSRPALKTIRNTVNTRSALLSLKNRMLDVYIFTNASFCFHLEASAKTPVTAV